MLKTFLELDKPVKRRFAVRVIDITGKKEGEVQCQYLVSIYNEQQQRIGGLVCETPGDEVSECTCCGNWFCNDHFSETDYQGYYLCLFCAKLTPGDIEMIIQFRESLNER